MQHHKICRGIPFQVAQRNLFRVRHWRIRWIFFSFILPVLLLAPGMMAAGIFPFGPHSTMAIDLRNEYVGFYEAFRHALTAPGGFLYSANKALGGEMVGTFAYYMMSPWNLLFFLFRQEQLPYIIELTQLIKVGLCGASFAIYLISAQKATDGYKVVLFSTLYGLNSFMTANLLNHMWMDPILLFPLVALGLERLVKNQGVSLYIFMLTLSIVTNFYIGYMSCMFCIFYFLYAAVRQSSAWKVEASIARSFGRAFLRFIAASFIVGLLCAFMLIPTLYSMILSKGSYTTDVQWTWALRFPIYDIFAKLIPAAFNYDQIPSGLPNLFVGTITNIGVILYFLNPRIRRKERVIALFILLFLFFSMNSRALTLIWHGGQYPIWYEFRFSWVVSFFMLVLAYRAFSRIDLATWQIFLCVVLLLGGLAWLSFHKEQYDFLTAAHFIAAAISIILCLICLYLLRSQQRMAKSILFFLAITEMCINAGAHLVVLNYETLEEFHFFHHAVTEARTGLQPSNTDFWRIDKYFHHDKNDGMRFQLASVSHFNSALERSSIDFIGALGNPVTKNSLHTTNPTKFTDAFFNIRYILQGNEKRAEDDVQGAKKLKNKTWRPDLQDMQSLPATTYANRFENTLYFPLGVAASQTALSLESDNANPLDYQEWLFNTLSGESEEINLFRLEEIDPPKSYNLQARVSDLLTTYQRQSLQEGYLEYTLPTKKGASYYVSVSNTLNSKNSLLFLDGEPLPNERISNHRSSQIYNIAAASDPDAIHTLRIQLHSDEKEFSINNVSLFSMDEKALQKAVDFQQEHGLRLEYHTDTNIRGEVNLTKQTPVVLFSLPYDAGWRITVDGQNTQPEETNSGLLALSLGEGKHHISMVYRPPYFEIWILISLSGLILWFLWSVSRWLSHRREKKSPLPRRYSHSYQRFLEKRWKRWESVKEERTNLKKTRDIPIIKERL